MSLFFRSALLFGVGFLTVGLAAAEENAPPPRSVQSSEPNPASIPQITFSSVHVDGPYVAMTFDDGPHTSLTPKLLDLLAAHHMKATFFVVGQNAAEYPEILKRAVRDGHEIGNHSWSHPNLGKISDDGVRAQLRKTDDAIVAAIGVHPMLMRPPYGSVTPRQKRWIHEEFGYKIIIWDVDPLDWKRPGPKVVCSRILREAKPGSIILAHDIHPPTIEAMPATFDQLQAKGFKFVTVSELIAMAKPMPTKASASPPAAHVPSLGVSPDPARPADSQPMGAAPAQSPDG
ncbi:MAG: polysaccharide deacetylase family protein [Chthoniobacterales bacterium]|nr:polysaccharide deacetylase family protein [Chthoniobacterales bacterium]